MQTEIPMDADGQIERLVVRQRPGRQSGLVILLLLTAAVSVAVLLLMDGIAYRLAGGFGVLLFGCLAFIADRRRQPADLLVVDWLGFIDQSTAAGAGFVPWDAVEDIALTRAGGQRFIAVRLKESSALEMSGAQRKRMAANLSLGYAHIRISLQNAQESYEEVFQRMFAYLFLYRSGQAFEAHY